MGIGQGHWVGLMLGNVPDFAILALALCLKTAPDVETRRAAVAAVPKVCRTGSHLASLVVAIEGLGGWGPLSRRAIAGWIESKSAEDLAYQVVKYAQRQDWRWADLLRLAHPPAA